MRRTGVALATILTALGAVALIGLVAARPAGADTQPTLAAAVSTLKPQRHHSVSVRRLSDNAELVRLRADQPRRIASVSKIFTVVTAIEMLGADYRFRTDFYADGVVGPSVENLYIKGYGDPYLISEEWKDIAAALPVLEIRDDVVVDDTYFSPNLEIVREPGVSNPYNARNASFATNFNTIEISVRGRDVSGEEQTPLTPFTVFDVRVARGGPIVVEPRLVDDLLQVRLRGPFGRRSRTLRFNLGDNPHTPGLYAGHLFAAIFSGAGGAPVGGAIRRGVVPPEAQLLYRHASTRPLSEIAAGLFEYSNNFVANQVFLVLGAEQIAAPATVQQSARLLGAEIDRRVGSGRVNLVEGSGLDPRNTASASAITEYLAAARATVPNLVELLPPRRDPRVRAKTGTYRDFGVRAMAGYLVDDTGEPYASFAMVCDHRQCARRAISRFDRLLEKAIASLAPTEERTPAPSADTAEGPD